MDVDARMQLFDLKTTYQFETIPGVTDYNMPLYSTQTEPGAQTIAPFPVYQGFFDPCFANGIQIPMQTQKDSFYKLWPLYLQPLAQVATGDGSTTNFSFQLPFFPAIPGHIDITGIINSGSTTDPIFTSTLVNIPTANFTPRVFITYTNQSGGTNTVTDTGQFLAGDTGGKLYGLLANYNQPLYPNNSSADLGTYGTEENTVNYATGMVNVTLEPAPPAGTPIQAQCYFIEQGIPRSLLFYNNTITLQPPPNTQYVIELSGYLTPAAFLSQTQAIPFGYMAEYIARGAARKILSDTGDWEQFNAYEPLFFEQERLVWKRSQRIFTSTRTGTIFSELQGQSPLNPGGT